MDFTNRNQPTQGHRADTAARSSVSNSQPTASSSDTPNNSRRFGGDKWWRASGIVFLFAVVILAIALLTYIGLSNPSSQKYVNSGEYQAVFVNVNGTQGGQVYFGHVQNITNDYYRLTDVFYIQQSATNTKSSDSNLVLQKLGCSQIHDPEDQMVINASQVLWWENLNNDGQVVKQINNYDKQHPNGQDCSANQPATQTPTNNSTSNAQNSNNTSTNSNNTSSTTNKNGTSGTAPKQ